MLSENVNLSDLFNSCLKQFGFLNEFKLSHGSSSRGYFIIVALLPKVKFDIAVFDAKNSTV